MRLISPFKAVKDDGGNVAIITALVVLPLTVLVGMSIDLSNASRVKVALQDAADSAALAIARNASKIADADVNTAATNYIDASFDKNAPFTATATMDRATLTVKVNATANVPTTFAGLLGKTQLPVEAYAEVQGQGYDYEIAMVLDNSGSMAWTLGGGGTKISELKKASTALLDAMLTTANAGKVKIGVVPFSSAVNVGSSYSGASWIDTTGAAAAHYENFTTTNRTRFALFSGSNGMKNVSWAGCVESRPIKVGSTVVDYDVNDATPGSAKPDTYFVPWFAPDEPDVKDSGSGKDSYSNSYLDDNKGNCSSNASNQTNRQGRVCKYKGETPSTSNGRGPNYLCESKPITPLTDVRTTLDSAITAMVAEGSTNIVDGVAWGWRVLSPTEPFTQGRSYTTARLTKVIVLMTDGQNSVAAMNTMNKSSYGSYGYMSKGRLGLTTVTSTTIADALDERTALACQNAKAAGITIYTVGLGDSNDVNQSLLTACASKTTYAYFPKTGSELTPVFEAIAASINKLRLSK